MQVLRKFLSLLFAVASAVCLFCAVWIVPRGVGRSFTAHPFLSVAVALVFPILAAILGMAWWKVWRDKPGARGWGVAASLAYVGVWGSNELINILRPHSRHLHLGTLLGIGIVGLIAFFWPERRNEVIVEEEYPAGRGTVDADL
jgi:hypothetical protein